MSYDTQARRDTPLALKLKQRIARDGPISVKDYMEACLYDPEHGYYVKRAAIGASGDFITAPEISQVFGELIGLWCAVVWQQMGSPARFDLIELGPGRGTMLRDALRAAGKVAGFLDAVRVGLIEPNATLRAVQAETLRSAPVPCAHLDERASHAGPTIFLANEVLDCLPIGQLVWSVGGVGGASWHERVVAIDGHGILAFDIGGPVQLRSGSVASLPAPYPGDILEDRSARGIMSGIADAARSAPVAALFIDYGHAATAYGDTLQAVRQHRFEHPLTSPGEADLTAHVDFAALASLVGEWNAAPDHPKLVVEPLVTQAALLGDLGVLERASRLMAANPQLAGTIEAGVARLISPTGMGARFKAMGLRSPILPPLPGFPRA